MEKYKAWSVEKGHCRVEGIDFDENFSLVSMLTSIIFLLSIVGDFDFEGEKMNVKTIFLHGDLEEEIYMNVFWENSLTVVGLLQQI